MVTCTMGHKIKEKNWGERCPVCTEKIENLTLIVVCVDRKTKRKEMISFIQPNKIMEVLKEDTGLASYVIKQHLRGLV